MLVPVIDPRIEERRHSTGYWVDARQIGTFLQVAVPTCERQILKPGLASVLFGNNVLDMERATERQLRQVTIFATVAG